MQLVIKDGSLHYLEFSSECPKNEFPELSHVIWKGNFGDLRETEYVSDSQQIIRRVLLKISYY